MQCLSSQTRITEKSKQPFIGEGHHDIEETRMLQILQNNMQPKQE